MSAVLEQGAGCLVRRTGLAETDVYSLLLEASRTVLTDSLPYNALDLYHTELSQHHWGIETMTTGY